MSDLTAPVGGEVAIAPAPTVPAETTPIDVREAARQLGRWRDEKAKKLAEPAEPKEAAPEPPKELAEKPDSDPETAPADTTEPEPAELPPIEAPRSWTKEEKEEFATYPREAQEKIARREQDRETALRRSQNETAEKLKGLTAKEQQAEQVRQQYENALPALLQALHDKQNGEFADIKTAADRTRLAVEDPFRFAQYQAQQIELGERQREFAEVQQRQAAKFETDWAEFSSKQDQLLLERAPELADKAKAGKIGDKAVEVLKDIGFNDQELAQLWTGKASVSLRDHRVQLLILDGVKYREAKANVAKPAPKPVPPVQRPGSAPVKGAQHAAQVQEAKEKLSTAKGTAAIEAGMELLRATRAARG